MFASKDLFFTNPSSGGYTIGKSVRLRSSASAYLGRTPASNGNLTTWTWSGWVKRGSLGASNFIFSYLYYNATGPINNQTNLVFNSSDQLQFSQTTQAGGVIGRLTTTSVYRDPSSWYHIVAVWNTSNATSTNRLLLYVNGVQITSFGTATYPAQNTTSFWNTNGIQTVGAQYDTSLGFQVGFDGYMTEVNFIDGQALTPTSFGAYNATTGVWQPIKYTGTYGTNGFYLNFGNNASTTTLGYDTSGNGNNWTTNNISLTAGSTYDSMTDVPTLTSATAANYCVMNPLLRFSYSGGYAGTFSDGNLKVATGGNPSQFAGTLELCDGAYYEITAVSLDVNRSYVGLFSVSLSNLVTSTSNVAYNGTYNVLYSCDGGIWVNTTTGSNQPYTGSTWTNGDVISVAYKSGKIYFAKNGVWQNSGVPASGTGYVATGWNAYGSLLPYCGYNSTFSANFGQQPFVYTPPTGYVALNTYNLPTSTITNGAAYMAATTYTGTGASLAVSNAVNGISFQPDFVWAKDRTANQQHMLFDSIRGVYNFLTSNTTAAEGNNNQTLTGFNSNGFQLGTNGTINNTVANIAWQWKAGTTSSSNTNGTITSTVSVGATQGFSVVTYTGNATNGATIGHGLGVTPSMIIVKNRSVVQNWLVTHKTLYTASANNYLLLNTTGATASNVAIWFNTAPTSTVFTVGNDASTNGSGNSLVAYCFSEVKGFSAFGSYTGNGSTDGPFVYTGFRPRYVMTKRTDSSSNWYIQDTSRSSYNVQKAVLFSESSSAETTDGGLDFLSNGFKLRNTDASENASGGTYIYMAFAEVPFKSALAR